MKKNCLILVTLFLCANVYAHRAMLSHLTLPITFGDGHTTKSALWGKSPSVAKPVANLLFQSHKKSSQLHSHFFYSYATVHIKLPMQIMQFEVKVVNQNVQLSWTAEGNEEVKSFEIERADDGQTYKTVGGKLANFIMGTASYEFVDALPKKNTELLYRVKVVGRDRAFTYSSIRPISIDEGRLLCKLKENPVHTTINMEVVYGVARNVQVSIYATSGQKVHTLTTRLTTGINLISIPAQNLIPGIYRLALDAGGERKVFSFVKE